MPDIFYRLALGLTDVNKMAQHSDCAEGFIERSGPQGVNRQVNAFPLRQIEHLFSEVAFLEVDDLRCPVCQRLFFFSRCANRADDRRPGSNRKLRHEQPDAAARGVNKYCISIRNPADGI